MNSRGLLIVQQSYRDRFVSDWTTFSQNKYAAPKRAAPFEKKIVENRTGRSLTCDLNLFQTKRCSNGALIRRRFVGEAVNRVFDGT